MINGRSRNNHLQRLQEIKEIKDTLQMYIVFNIFFRKAIEIQGQQCTQTFVQNTMATDLNLKLCNCISLSLFVVEAFVIMFIFGCRVFFPRIPDKKRFFSTSHSYIIIMPDTLEADGL